MRGTTSAKDFLMQELIENRWEFSKNKKNQPGIIDQLKMNLIQIVIEWNIIKKLFDDYETCLEEMTSINHELSLLGDTELFSVPKMFRS